MERHVLEGGLFLDGVVGWRFERLVFDIMES